MYKAKRVTILDVAREAGVSAGTVSRTMNGTAKVKPEVREHVLAVVRRLGYEPNSFAQTLRGWSLPTVGCLVSDLSNPLHGVFLTAVEERLQAAGLMMLVANSHNLPAREMEAFTLFRRRLVNGLILTFGNETSDVVQEILSRSEVPMVVLDRAVPERDHCDVVTVDHRAGALQATGSLLRLGHRRIALLTPPDSIWPGRERLAGFRKAHADAGVAVDERLICILDAASSLAYGAVKGLCALAAPPTAIICLGTQMLAGVLTALASSELRVPEDMSLIGVGDTDLVRLHTPPLTTVRWDVPKLGHLAAEMLLDRLHGRVPPTPRRALLPTEFVQRASCAAPH